MAKIKLKKKKTKKKIVRRKPKQAVSATYQQDLRKKYVEFKNKVSEIKNIQQEAFDRLFEFGELLIEHEPQIKKDFGTWGKFAEENGMDASTVSRCRASVKDFKTHGAKTLADARKLLKKRGFQPSAKLMENNINRILTDSKDAGRPKTPKDKSVKRERHLNELRNMSERASEIMEQHEPDDDLYQEAVHINEFAEETLQHLNSLDISQKQWNSKAYLDFLRNINFDVVLGEPVDKTEPHHVAPDGTFGSQGGKVADFWALPISRDTHNKWHSGEIDPSLEEIAEYHRWTMAMFLFNSVATDLTAGDIEDLEEAEVINE